MDDTLAVFLDHVDARMPKRGTPWSAGLDLFSVEDIIIHPGQTVMVNTGIRVAIKHGFEGQIRSRSGLAKNGVTVANSPGTIDSDYRGTVRILLHVKPNSQWFDVKIGDRIAQLVVAPIWTGDPVKVESLDETKRGDGGFGSTGS